MKKLITAIMVLSLVLFSGSMLAKGGHSGKSGDSVKSCKSDKSNKSNKSHKKGKKGKKGKRGKSGCDNGGLELVLICHIGPNDASITTAIELLLPEEAAADHILFHNGSPSGNGPDNFGPCDIPPPS